MTIHFVHAELRYALLSHGCLRKPDLLRTSRAATWRFSHLSANIHPLLNLEMPPDYELQSYWKARFENESDFEWLGDGSDTILPHLRAHLTDPRVSARSSPSRPARLLHIGAGTSSLSERIRELYHDVYGAQVDERAIVNTDFAENLVAREREKAEAAFAVGRSRTGMQWVCANLLKWGELEAALQPEEERHTFDLVVDKSTSDAISCGEDVSYSNPDPSIHPALNEILAAQGGKKISISPVELLAVHLASLVRPGGLWVGLTFSPHRFPFLASLEERRDTRHSHAATYWTIDEVVTVDAPTGMEGSAYAPVVQHYIFLLRRKSP
ncbi:hypothetical protein BD311DRAFT_294473 [Dichomitus squalens]|uniref:Methyltransferase type 11 domain-containing protein n=1 Tax=Dichomitus squalens TaxID=114155 RepID=A0A4Q9N2N5_9APHY|nr:hypothetical protein BD311DRAFT_294473 [Dichomitus squalens]